MADQLTLFHHPRSRGTMVRWMLEELGVPYDVSFVDFYKGEQQSPEFLAINPMGKLPVLRHGDVTVTETTAICLYLADAFPEAGLAPPVGDPLRGPYLMWCVFYPGCLEPAFTDKWHGRTDINPLQAGYGDMERTLGRISMALSSSPWLLGDRFSTGDVLVGSALRFAAFLDMPIEDPVLNDYVARINARPARQRATEADAALLDPAA